MKKEIFSILFALVLVLTLGLGTAVPAVAQATTPEIDEVVFIHRVGSSTPPDESPAWGRAFKGDEEKRYKLLQGGVKWTTTPVTYYINTSGASLEDGTSATEAFDAIVESFENWDAESVTEILDDTPSWSTDLLAYDADGWQSDSNNVVSWYNLADDVIAMCRMRWYVNTKEMSEFDIVFNTHFTWTWADDEAPIEDNWMDIENIGTHEAGHTLVLDDLYRWKDADLTMYGYSDYAEVKKQSLGVGDILGVEALYGEKREDL